MTELRADIHAFCKSLEDAGHDADLVLQTIYLFVLECIIRAGVSYGRTAAEIQSHWMDMFLVGTEIVPAVYQELLDDPETVGIDRCTKVAGNG